MTERQQVGVGIIGLGRSGYHLHFKVVQQIPDFRIVAVVDQLADRRDEAVAEVGCRAYEDVDALLNDDEVELVVVATPSHTHADLACRALAAGKHVLVEKPMALSVAEADRMIEAAKQNDRILTAYQIRRLDPDFLRVQEILRSNVLGPLVMARITRHSYRRRNDWQTLKRFGGGMLNNWGSHFVDLGLQLVDGPIDRIFADMQQTVSAGDAEDHFKVAIKAASGAVIEVEVSSCIAYPGPEWLVVGKYGTLTGSSRRFQYKYYDPTQVPVLKADEGPAEGRSYGKPEQLPWVEKTEEFPKGVDRKILFYEALYKTIRQGRPLLVTPESVRRQIEVLDECRKQCGEL